MNTKRLLTIGAFVFGFAFISPAHAASADDVLGAWVTQGGKSRVTIFKCGKAKDKFCGRITWLSEPNYPAGDAEAGKAKLDRNNPDASKRTRPVMGMNLVWGFKWDGEKWSGGKIYNPNDGKTYSCFMELVGPKKLKVRGYVGLAALGKTVHWTR